MIKVDFLICGRRGFDVLKHHIKTHSTQAVNVVASYADKKVANDPYDELVSFCREHSILFKVKEDYNFNEDVYRVVIGWQWMFPANNKTIVLHDSLLPKYRGFSPLANSLIKGEHELGVTAFITTEGFDEGPIVGQEKISIDYPMIIIKAMELITPLYISLCEFIVNQLNAGGPLPAVEQDHYLATYSLWRDEADYSIDWNSSAEQIRRFIDAVGYPYSGAISLLNGEKICIKSAEIFGDVNIENRTAGKVIFIKNNCPVIVCKEGLLKITEASNSVTGLSIIPFTKIRSRFH